MSELEALRKENEELKQKLSDYEQDGFVGMYYSLCRKVNQLGREVDSLDIGLKAKNKGAMERFSKAMKELKTLSDNLDWLKEKAGIKKDEEVPKEILKAKNPVEERAMSK